ncbi:MAG: tRNA pseudouridine(13) synthase TruD [Phycisphaerales bacterium JB065]
MNEASGQPVPMDERDGTALSWAPFFTAPVAPIPGCIKQRDEEFLVEELPRYEPCGEGEHIYLFIEKKGLSTSDLLRIVAEHFKVGQREIGYAGMKDKNAITRQIISIHVPGRRPEDFPMLSHDQIGVLWADLHTNKLRRGHLLGNRFSVWIRNTEATRVHDAHRILKFLSARGMPNFYGHQRFGTRRRNHELGRLFLRKQFEPLLDLLLGPDPNMPELNREAREAYAAGDFKGAIERMPNAQRTELAALRALAKGRKPADAVQAVPLMQRVFWVTAWQSAIFNRVLARRLAETPEGTEPGSMLTTLRPGDIAFKHDSHAMFRVDEDTAADPETSERLKRREISPTGPMFGVKTMLCDGPSAEIENAELEREGVTMEDLERAVKSLGDSVGGTRRPLRTLVTDPEVEAGVDEHGHYIRCAFDLPAGSFATMLVRELLKSDRIECRQSLIIEGHEEIEDTDG